MTTTTNTTATARYAAVLTDTADGFTDENTDRVWGTGATPGEAREDVRNWTDAGEEQDRLVEAVEVHPITAEQAAAIESGTVFWSSLPGIGA